MEDTASKGEALHVARLLEEHGGVETICLAIGQVCSWADYFVITTSTSQGHTRGLLKHLQEWLREGSGREIRNHKRVEVDGWTLIDCGTIVIHIMNSELRAFYELEKLWVKGERLFPNTGE